MERNKQLTQNFNLNEFIRDEDPMPSLSVLRNIDALAHRLQAIRDILKRRITINSGYRTAKHNAEVGGVSDSQHLLGKAADIVVEGLAPKYVQQFLVGWSGGMGSYATFTHVDIGPKRRWKG